MAERSTAAVDVANESGQPPLAADESGATTDGVNAQDSSNDAKQQSPEAPAPSAPAAEPPELHSGHKLARRYRLEECRTRRDGFSSWRAVDEKLRRAVGVHILPADHSRARGVLAAARSAALLGDPRFVQVLDAVEENDLVYVVHEWLPGATELTALLADGPLEAHEAYQLVSQVSQAMAAANREGLAHLQLAPASVLRTESGQYRIQGLAVSAALHGIESDRPKRQDTEAIGALLYAALTRRWPYPHDAHGLTGLPKNLGLVAPEQVRARVHRGLSDLAMRALVNDGATPSRNEKPCTTPEELAEAVVALPKIRPPEPDVPAYGPKSYRQPPARPGTSQPVPATPPPPALPGRVGKAIKWGVAALLLAALGLGSWQVAETLLSGGKNGPVTSDNPNKDSVNATVHGHGKGHSMASYTLAIHGASEFAPDGSDIQAAQVSNAVDGNPNTAWVTPEYIGYSNFGNLPERKSGSGIVVDLGEPQQVTGVVVAMFRPGQTVEVRAASPDAGKPIQLADFPLRIEALHTAGSTLQVKLNRPVTTRYVLIHITALPGDGTPNGFRGGISEIKVLGTAH